MPTDIQNVIEAPLRVTHRYGLFSVLDFIPIKGIAPLAWDSLGCTALVINGEDCLNGDDTPDLTGTIGCANTGGQTTFTVSAFDDSSLGRPPRTRDPGRAQERLAQAEQAAVELQLVTALAAAIGTSITDVTANMNSLVVAASPAIEKVKGALGLAEMAAQATGGEGLIIISRAFVPLLGDALTVTGSMLRTKTGTPVAATAGAGASERFYAFPGFVAGRGDVATGLGYNTALNDSAHYAERDYAFGWECGAVAVNLATIA